jgi:hypothetical protein
MCFHREPKTEFEVDTNVAERRWLNMLPQVCSFLLSSVAGVPLFLCNSTLLMNAGG